MYVLSHFDIIKHMLSKPTLHSRIWKWAPALIGYSLTYMSLKAMKGQVVADFIIDHVMVKTLQAFVVLEPWKINFVGSSHK